MNSLKKSYREIDGKRLYYLFIAGAKKIIENQVKLNKINVFPVNDGDTGSNMASTVQPVIELVKPDRSYKIMADLIAETTLVNARGNSGIIFAQFLYGVSNETSELKSITLEQFIESVKKSVTYIYNAVAQPVEGTMLTVISSWANYISENRTKFSDFDQLFISSETILEKALAETKMKLEILRKANVVDAGANAFVYFIKGIIEFIQTKNIRQLIQIKSEVDSSINIEEHVPEHIDFRYCTEAMVKNLNIDQKSLSKFLQEKGNSVVVAGGEKTSRLHVHTNDPPELFEQLQQYGIISYQKVDDMLRQNQAVYNRKWNIALVTDSACDLPQELFDKFHIHLVPINIYFGENHYLDKVTIQPEQFYSKLNKGGDFPKTAQINEKAFRNLYSQLCSHYDAVIAVHLTGKFSGTYFNSKKAAEEVSLEFKKPIHVIDSKTLSGALGLVVLRAAKAIEKGESLDQITKDTEKWISDSRIFVSVKTLKYMVRGGRVSPLKGFIAKMLNINPIVSMDKNGKSIIFGKTYTQKSNMQKVLKHIKDTSQNKQIWNYIVLHANNEEAASWYTEEMKEYTGKEPAAVVNISPVIGANAGLGAASVAFMYN